MHSGHTLRSRLLRFVPLTLVCIPYTHLHLTTSLNPTLLFDFPPALQCLRLTHERAFDFLGFCYITCFILEEDVLTLSHQGSTVHALNLRWQRLLKD